MTELSSIRADLEKELEELNTVYKKLDAELLAVGSRIEEVSEELGVIKRHGPLIAELSMKIAARKLAG